MNEFLMAYDLDPLFPNSSSRAELLEELMPGLNALFGSEYWKYEGA